MNQTKLFLAESEYSSIIALISNKFAFDKMFLQEATTKVEIHMMEGKLYEAGLLFAKLQKHPTYVTESTAKWLVGYIMEAEMAYKSSIDIFHSLGKRNTKQLEVELENALALHEKLNEFLIDCLED